MTWRIPLDADRNHVVYYIICWLELTMERFQHEEKLFRDFLMSRKKKKNNSHQKLQISNFWLLCSCWRHEDDKHRAVVMDMSSAFSISLATFLLIKETAYSIKTASHGSVIGPSLGNPCSSSAIFKSSLNIALLR